MDPVTHTLIAMGCCYLAYAIGRYINEKENYHAGFEDGIYMGVEGTLEHFRLKHNMKVDNIVIKIEQEEDEEDDAA